MNLSRIRRLVQLIGVLQAGKALNADSLAQVCNVSRRTVFRDLDMLRSAGVPVLFDEQQQLYRIPGTYYLPPTNFTPDEALAVIVLCYEFGGASGLPFYGSAQTAAQKLQSALPPALRDQMRQMTAGVQIQMQPSNPLKGRQETYQTLLLAIRQRRSARMVYDSASEPGPFKTKLSPYRLLFNRHSWYVVGRSSVHREVRTFNLGRIEELEPLNEPFNLPRTFSIETYLGNAWNLIPEPGPDEEVVIRFEKTVARNVAEVRWHRTQRSVFLDDGRLEYRVTVSGLHEISWWVLGYGDQAEVLEPPELRRLVADRASRLAARYNGHA